MRAPSFVQSAWIPEEQAVLPHATSTLTPASVVALQGAHASDPPSSSEEDEELVWHATAITAGATRTKRVKVKRDMRGLMPRVFVTGERVSHPT